MNNTTNYNLVKPDEGSSGWANDVNINFDKIDTHIKSNEEGVSSQASNLSQHIAGSTKHPTSDIISQLCQTLNLDQDGSLEQLLLAIVGSVDGLDVIRSLRDLFDHTRGVNYRHTAVHIEYLKDSTSQRLQYVIDDIRASMSFLYVDKHTAEGTSLVISEADLKANAGFGSSLEESVDTGLMIQITKDESSFYAPTEVGSIKINKKIETYTNSTKEHLDNIAISGLTSGSTYKIVVSYKKVDASDPEELTQ